MRRTNRLAHRGKRGQPGSGDVRRVGRPKSAGPREFAGVASVIVRSGLASLKRAKRPAVTGHRAGSTPGPRFREGRSAALATPLTCDRDTLSTSPNRASGMSASVDSAAARGHGRACPQIPPPTPAVGAERDLQSAVHSYALPVLEVRDGTIPAGPLAGKPLGRGLPTPSTSAERARRTVAGSEDALRLDRQPCTAPRAISRPAPFCIPAFPAWNEAELACAGEGARFRRRSPARAGALQESQGAPQGHPPSLERKMAPAGRGGVRRTQVCLVC